MTNTTLANRQAAQLRNANNLIGTITAYTQNNSKLGGTTQFFDLQKMVSRLRLHPEDYAEVNSQFAELRANIKAAGLETDTLSTKFMNLFGQHFSTMIAMAALHAMQDACTQIYQNVVDIDTAMTELKKVTDETDSAYGRFLDKAGKTATELGASISDYVESTAEWARLGYNIGDSSELARVSTLYSNVGDKIDSASDAASYLISTLKGFGLAAGDAEHVLDVINKISNEEPVSAKGIGEILTRSSAAMSAAGNSFEETVALGTAMNSILQDEEKAGTTLKTISMYLRSTKTELEDAGESTEGMAETTSKLKDNLLALTHGKVNILSDDNTYKNTYQIIKEISQAWGDMTDKERAATTELLGGKRNANAVSALISNFDIAEDSLSKAGAATGSALQENEKYLSSIEGHMSLLQAAFQNLSTDTLDSGLIKGVLDIATGFVNATDAAVDFAGVLPTILTALSGILTMTGTKGGKRSMPAYASCALVAA